MWKSVVLAMVLCAALTGRAGAQAAPPAPAAAPPPADAATPAPATTPAATTTVTGAVPDLAGRWLLLFDIKINDKTRTTVSFLDVTAGKAPQVVEHFVDLPADLKAALEASNAEGTPWIPTAEAVATIARQWTDLTDGGRGVVDVTNDLWGPDGFDDTIKKEPDLEGSQWVLRQTYTFAPGGQRPARQINVYGAKTSDATGWRGFGIVAQVIVAPFPVPISFKGEFRMVRVGAAADTRGLLARLLDAFKGCGR
jgi:hypothetical protein